VSHNIVVTMHSPRVEVSTVGKSVPELDRWSKKYYWSPQGWSVVNLRVGWLVGEVVTSP
jgi:hypothetical protein